MRVWFREIGKWDLGVDVDEFEKSEDLRRDFGVFFALKSEERVTGEIPSAPRRLHHEVQHRQGKDNLKQKGQDIIILARKCKDNFTQKGHYNLAQKRLGQPGAKRRTTW